jgi:hypothetical protein
METRNRVFPVAVPLAAIALVIWGTASGQRLDAFGVFMAATVFALFGWHFVFDARRICGGRTMIARHYYPRLLKRIWPPASFRTRGSQLAFQAGGILAFIVSAFLFCAAFRRTLSH